MLTHKGPSLIHISFSLVSPTSCLLQSFPPASCIYVFAHVISLFGLISPVLMWNSMLQNPTLKGKGGREGGRIQSTIPPTPKKTPTKTNFWNFSIKSGSTSGKSIFIFPLKILVMHRKRQTQNLKKWGDIIFLEFFQLHTQSPGLYPHEGDSSLKNDRKT